MVSVTPIVAMTIERMMADQLRFIWRSLLHPRGKRAFHNGRSIMAQSSSMALGIRSL
jgi:hypothetical protein